MISNKTFEVEYSRTVNLGNFNSLKITVREQFDEDRYSKSEALAIVRSFVLKSLDDEVLQLEAEKQPVDPTRTEKMLPLKQKKNVTVPQSHVNDKPIWTAYNKQPSKPGTEGWAFANKVDPLLIQDLDEYAPRGHWFRINNMEYRLSGNNLNLVNRRPLKKEE